MENFEELAAAVRSICSHYFDLDCIDLYNVGDMDEYTAQNPRKFVVSVDHSEKMVEAWNAPMYKALDIYSSLLDLGFELNTVYTTNDIIVMDMYLDDDSEVIAYIYIK